MNNVSFQEIAKILRENNNFYILTHISPDGDTLGSAFALCLALQKINKNAKVLCSDEIPKKYEFLYRNIEEQNFEPKYIISVDVADSQLLGEKLGCYADKINLSIDHHSSSKRFSELYYVDSITASTAEIIYKIIKACGIDIDSDIAGCIYTGISTDTGSFRHSNTNAPALRAAADMIDLGADAFKITKIMFDTKSRAALNLEKTAIESLEFFCQNKCALISLSYEEIENSGACKSALDGICSIPRQVEGVLVGIFIKEKEPDTFKISLRTDASVDAVKICAEFGGGGHRCAAGCSISGDFNDAKRKIISAVAAFLGEKE